MAAPTIYPIDLPVTLLSVSLSGEADPNVSGFIYSPSGGTFASGSTSGGTSWSYDFLLMSESEIFTIQSIDVSGNVSLPSASTISYEITPPLLISPGTPKSLTDNISVSGYSNTKFDTLSGDFLNDNVLVKDVVLATSSMNRSVSREITKVEQTSLETLPFPNNWEVGDSILVYSQNDRPTYKSNKLTIRTSGKANIDAQKVIISLSEIEKLKLYSQIEELYTIDSSNDTLHLQIGNEEKTINLSHGGNLLAYDIVTDINSFFSQPVAVLEGTTFYFEGDYLKVFDASGNNYFGFEENEYFVTKIISSLFDFEIISGEDDFFDMVIDNQNVNFSMGTGSFSASDLADKINSYTDKKVAFVKPEGLILLAKDSIQVKKNHLKSKFTKSLVKTTNFDNTTGEWNSTFQVLANSNILYAKTLDAFYKLTDSSTLEIEYKIDTPTLTTSNLDVKKPFISLTGDYDIEGKALTVNGSSDSVIKEGSWSISISPLNEGSNAVIVLLEDIFGSFSDPLEFNVSYTNPDTQIVPIDPSSGGPQWSNATLVPEFPQNISDAFDAIDKVMNPIISAMKTVIKLFELVKAYIRDRLGKLTALRLALQAFLDELLAILDNLINGTGIFFLSTIPGPQDMSANRDFLDQFSGGFSAFLNKLIDSMDDPLDPQRPQFDANTVTGGYVLAASATAGLETFLDTLDSLVNLFEKSFMDDVSKPVENLKAVGENQRVVLTWEYKSDRFNVNSFKVLRSEIPGGTPITEEVRAIDRKTGQSTTVTKYKRDPVTKEIMTEYDEIGEISPPAIGAGSFFVVPNFKFINGAMEPFEQEEQTLAEYVTEGTMDMLAAIQEGATYNVGESLGDAPENGKTYFYKVVPVKGDKVGLGHEIQATPIAPELTEVTEDLWEQVADTVGEQVTSPPADEIEATFFEEDTYEYKLSGAIYDKNKKLIASDPPDSHITIIADGARITPKKVNYSRGRFTLAAAKAPETSLMVTYSTKAERSPTKAFIAGRNSGPFTIKRNDERTNRLRIMVGMKRSKSYNTSGEELDMGQNITFVRDFTNAEGEVQDSVVLTGEQVAEKIRDCTMGMGGLRVVVDSTQRIILIDDNQIDPYTVSYIEVLTGNTALGFDDGQNSRTGPIGGTPPDWSSFQPLALIPSIGDALKYIENIGNQFLSSIEGATKALEDFLDLMTYKLEALTEIFEKIKALLQELTVGLTIRGEISYLQIPARTGGTEYLKTALRTSTGYPNADYVGGMIFVYGDGASKNAMNFFAKALGIG